MKRRGCDWERRGEGRRQELRQRGRRALFLQSAGQRGSRVAAAATAEALTVGSNNSAKQSFFYPLPLKNAVLNRSRAGSYQTQAEAHGRGHYLALGGTRLVARRRARVGRWGELAAFPRTLLGLPETAETTPVIGGLRQR